MFKKYKNNQTLYLLGAGYVLSIIVFHNLKSIITESSVLNGVSGDLIISAISGIVFFIIGNHFQKKTNYQIQELHEELAKEAALRNYDRMVSFLKSGKSYDFFLSEERMYNGDLWAYSMRGKSNGDDAVCFATNIHKEYVIYVEDIAYRSVLSEEKLAEYIYGPIEVGNSYYLRFSDGKWYLDLDHTDKKKIEISWYGRFGGVYSKPDANSLYFDKNSNTTVISSFIYNAEGEEADWGRTCEIHIDNSSSIFLRLAHNGELKRVHVTFPDSDFSKESPFIKIEKVEGYFTSKSALDNFKNLINMKLQEKSIHIPEIEFYRDKLKGQ